MIQGESAEFIKAELQKNQDDIDEVEVDISKVLLKDEEWAGVENLLSDN